MNIRASMMGWNLLFLNKESLSAGSSAIGKRAWNRGKYLVEGAAHCSTCHTPRGFLMQELGGQAFAGGAVGPWYAPNITSDVNSGIGSWSRGRSWSNICVREMRMGRRRPRGAWARPLSTASSICRSPILAQWQPMCRRSPPSTIRQTESRALPSAGHLPTSGLLRGRDGIRNEDGDPTGAELFQANCASCHSDLGQGSKDGYYPSLFSNSALGSNNPSDLIATILNGVDRTTAMGQAYMPGFSGGPNDLAALTDREIVLLGDYLLERYGRPGVVVTAEQVAEVRRGGPSSLLITLARTGIAAAVVIVVFILIFCFRQKENTEQIRWLEETYEAGEFSVRACG